MSHIWTFTEESKVLLERCLNAVPPSDDSNKWLQRFGPKNLKLMKNVNNTIIEDSPDIIIIAPNVNQGEDIVKALEEFLDPDIDIMSKFNYLEQKSAVNPEILTKLGENLPINTVERLIQHVFDTKDLNNRFLEDFFEHFVPVYIKRDNSRLSTELLFRTYKLYFQYFKILLGVILRYLEIRNNVINDFLTKLSNSELTDLLNLICNIELTSEQFSHNLFNIYAAYKGCNKSDITQNNIKTVLKTHCQFCTTDKNFGKLLLAFLQDEKILKHDIDKLVIKEILNVHNSPFKRPCVTVFNEIYNR